MLVFNRDNTFYKIKDIYNSLNNNFYQCNLIYTYNPNDGFRKVYEKELRIWNNTTQIKNAQRITY